MDELAKGTGRRRKTFRDTLGGKQIRDFNAALCEYYARHCRVSPLCPPADREEHLRLRSAACVDLSQNCLSWARRGGALAPRRACPTREAKP